MDVSTLTTVFMWCIIINVGILSVWMIVFTAAPEFTYRLQTKFFPMPRETYTVVNYGALGLYKIVFMVFVLVPYVALLIAT